jgi:hypothetical protein
MGVDRFGVVRLERSRLVQISGPRGLDPRRGAVARGHGRRPRVCLTILLHSAQRVGKRFLIAIQAMDSPFQRSAQFPMSPVPC